MDTNNPIFAKIRKERGGVAAIHQAFLSFLEGADAHFEFYKRIFLQDNLPLPRSEREWLAVKVSEANQCPYCIKHHIEAFKNHSEANEADGPSHSDNSRLELLTRLARVLTQTPWKASVLRDNFIGNGFSEAEWQHAVMVVSYFNFANRCAHAMAIEVENDFETLCL